MTVQDLEKEFLRRSRLLSMLSLVTIFLLSLLIILFIYNKYLLEMSQVNRYESRLVADELRQSSDDLTRMARTYVVTGDSKFEKMYWEILAIRNGELPRPERYQDIYWDFMASSPVYARPDGASKSIRQRMEALGFTDQEFSKLKQAENYSNALVWTERVAMNAMKGLYADEQQRFIIKKGSFRVSQT